MTSPSLLTERGGAWAAPLSPMERSDENGQHVRFHQILPDPIRMDGWGRAPYTSVFSVSDVSGHVSADIRRSIGMHGAAVHVRRQN